MYAVTFVSGAAFGAIVLALLLRKTVRNPLTSTTTLRRSSTRP